ncbi:oxalate:formate antiporter-like [Ruditapes philippinarum]|uniref:oxalate:formate antiporter-like n=1 Tax=Ruditapes philippinarum TaxID=129788 RepID=UPI00295B4E0E|nr:oxalate:formate antiporter-like [Ruditapes philippinarum]
MVNSLISLSASTDLFKCNCGRFADVVMIRAAFVILGGVLVHLCLGSFYVFGNLTPYVISYLRNRTDEHTLRNVDNLWIMNAANLVSPFGMVFGGVLDRRLGVRAATAIGCCIFCSGWALTYFTVQKSLVLVSLSYGALTQFGLSTAYGPPVQNASKWLPKRPALAVGLIVCGVGGGAMVFNQVITAYLNPDNLSPDFESSDGQKYFTDKGLLDRLPTLFLILAGIYAVCQIIGIAALSKPPEDEVEAKRLLNDSRSSDGQIHGLRLSVKDVLLQMIKSKNSNIVLAFTFLIQGGMVFAISLYKAYGQTFINDDHFLATVGSISSVFNSICRPLWGTIYDKFGFQIAVKFVCTLFTCLSCTIMFTETMGKYPFMLWICGLYASFCGIFSICPTTLGKLFGVDNMVITMGLFFSALSVSSLCAGFIGLNLQSVLGWHGLFVFGGSLGAIAFFVTFFFDGKDQNGKPI